MPCNRRLPKKQEAGTARASVEQIQEQRQHQSETHEPEQHGAYHKVNKVLEKYVGRVLASRKSSLAKRKPRLHKEYQHGCKQHPHSVKRQSYFLNTHNPEQFNGEASCNSHRCFWFYILLPVPRCAPPCGHDTLWEHRCFPLSRPVICAPVIHYI